MPKTYNDIRQAIRDRMHEIGMTQAALTTATAERGKPISPMMLRLFLNHNRTISTDRLESICATLGLTLQIVRR